MPTRNDSTKVSSDLQERLAEYGVLRKEVMKKAPPKASGAPNFFGIKDSGGEVELKFGESIKAIQDAGMTVAMAAPDNETFDMLVTTNFDKAKQIASEDELRTYLRKIVDNA